MRLSKLFWTMLMAIMLLVLFQFSLADVPHAINYQGRLTDDTGLPVPDGKYDVQFTIYSDSTSTSPSEVLWTSGFQQVITTDGLFAYMLGSNTPLDDYFFRERSNIFLGITLQGYSEMSPRQRMTSSSYAFQALRADTATVVSGTDYIKAEGDTLEGNLYFGLDAGNFIIDDHYTDLRLRESGNTTAYLWGDSYGTLQLYDEDYDVTVMLDASNFSGGLLSLRDENGAIKISLDGGNVGDLSVSLPDDAINSNEILDEPGIACVQTTSIIYLAQDAMTDIVVLDITIPEPGYIYLHGRCNASINDDGGREGVYLQIDTASGGVWNPSHTYFHADVSTIFADYIPMSTDQIYYFESAGSYQFRLEGKKSSTESTISAREGALTAMYFPTSYGTVEILAKAPGDSPEATAVSIENDDGTMETAYKVDLRYYELRAKEARLRAQKAELELIKARERSASE